MDDEPQSSQRRQSFRSIVGSVFASMFGVQSSRKHKEDFTKGSIGAYIAVGLIATLLFILTVWGVVKLVVSVATPS